MLLVKESVRWLAKKGRNEEALQNLIWVRGGDTSEVRAEFDEILAGLQEEIRATEGVTWRELLLPANRFRVFMVVTMQLGVQLTGNTSLAYYAPQIFNAIGAGQSSLLITGFFGVVKTCAVAFFCLFVVGRIGRKTAFMGGAAAMGSFMLAIAVIVATHPPASSNSHVSSASIAAIAMVYCEAASYNMSWGPVSWLYLGEIFPTRIREFGIAVGAAAQWLFNFMLSEITPHAINNLGWRTFLMFSIFNYALVIYAFFVLREVSALSRRESRFRFLMNYRLQANLWKRWKQYLGRTKLPSTPRIFVIKWQRSPSWSTYSEKFLRHRTHELRYLQKPASAHQTRIIKGNRLL
jgi:hypothetical protein